MTKLTRAQAEYIAAKINVDLASIMNVNFSAADFNYIKDKCDHELDKLLPNERPVFTYPWQIFSL